MGVEVDARGLSCPEPVMLTMNAMKAHGGEEIKVLVSETAARDNVKKCAESKGKKVSVTQKGEDFELLIQ